MAENVYRVAQHGAFLATRHSARQARHAVEAMVPALPAHRQVTLDFGGVEAATGAFADELVANLVGAHGHRIAVTGANSDVAETIRRAIVRRGCTGLTAAWGEDDDPGDDGEHSW